MKYFAKHCLKHFPHRQGVNIFVTLSVQQHWHQPSQNRTIPCPTPRPCLPCQREVDWRQGTNCRFVAFCLWYVHLFDLSNFLPSRRRDCYTTFRSVPHLCPPLPKVRCCRPKKFGRLPEGLPPVAPNTAIPTIISKIQPSLAPHHILSSLFKGEVMSDK